MAVRGAPNDIEVDATAQRIGDAVRDRVKPLLREYLRLGRQNDLSVEALVDRVTASVPTPSAWSEALGAFYTTTQVAALLGGVSRQALEDRRKRRTILALRTQDGRRVYPAFQFAGREVLAGLGDVLQSFEPGTIDDWSLAGWLVARRRDLQGSSVIDLLRAGNRHPAVALAKRAAARLAT